jgi:tetratricopeptide (TPR) repeat protein
MLFRTTDDAQGLRNALNGLGEVEGAQGDFERAEALYEESLALARQEGEEHGIGLLLYNLALVAVHEGDAPRATDLLTQVVRVWSRLGYRLPGERAVDKDGNKWVCGPDGKWFRDYSSMQLPTTNGSVLTNRQVAFVVPPTAVVPKR